MENNFFFLCNIYQCLKLVRINNKSENAFVESILII